MPQYRTWNVYHFHDTSETAPVKLTGQLHDNQYLRHDAGNLAAYLYMLKHFYANIYEQIVKIVRVSPYPFFDDFVLEPRINPESKYTFMLMWRQKDSDYPFLASQLSDGSTPFHLFGHGFAATGSAFDHHHSTNPSSACIPTPSALLGALIEFGI